MKFKYMDRVQVTKKGFYHKATGVVKSCYDINHRGGAAYYVVLDGLNVITDFNETHLKHFPLQISKKRKK